MNFLQRLLWKEPVDWSDAYPAKPQFYQKPDGSLFAAIAFSENTKTILPRNPHQIYQVDGKTVADWKLVLVSTSRQEILCQVDYFTAIRKFHKHILDRNDDYLLVEEIGLEDLSKLI